MFSNAGIRLLSTRREPDRTGQEAIVRSTASLFAVVTSWSKKTRLRSCSPRGISAPDGSLHGPGVLNLSVLPWKLFFSSLFPVLRWSEGSLTESALILASTMEAKPSMTCPR